LEGWLSQNFHPCRVFHMQYLQLDPCRAYFVAELEHSLPSAPCDASLLLPPFPFGWPSFLRARVACISSVPAAGQNHVVSLPDFSFFNLIKAGLDVPGASLRFKGFGVGVGVGGAEVERLELDTWVWVVESRSTLGRGSDDGSGWT